MKRSRTAAAPGAAPEPHKPAARPPSPCCCGLRPTVVLCVLVASSFSFLLGYDIGIMSGAKRLVLRDLGLATEQVEVLVGSLNLVSGIGGLAAGRLADGVGRRRTGALACVLTLLGSLGMAVSGSFAALLVGRVVCGLGVGGCFQVAPLYVAEVAPKRVRGALISSFDLFINIGILAGYVVGWALGLGGEASAWRLMLGLGAAPPALILCGLWWMPESPRWLVAAGAPERAAAVLHTIYEPTEAAETFAELQQEDSGGGRRAPPLSTAQQLRRVLLPAAGAPRALMVAGLGAAFWQQATGVEAAVYYTPETLERAGITDESSLLLATVGVGAVKVAFIVLAAFLVERCGRVRLLLASQASIAASHLLIAASFFGGGITWLALLGQCAFMGAFSLGAGPCSMMVASELFPLQVRGFALGVATLVNRATSGTIALTFLSLSAAITPAGAYCLFAALALVACAFTARCVPETKGKSLEEIEREAAERHVASAALVGAGAGRVSVELSAVEGV